MDSERDDRRDEFAGGGEPSRGTDESGNGANPGSETGQGGYPQRGHRLDQGAPLSGRQSGADDRPDDGGGPVDGGRPDDDAYLRSGGVRGQRRDGLRRVRHMSNWTAAALLAGTGVATVALATHATQTGTASTSTASASGHSTQGTGVQATAPHVQGSVVTSGGSGATVTTTTKVVNGHVVTTRVRHPAVWHDN
jgi:hypothetical protein